MDVFMRVKVSLVQDGQTLTSKMIAVKASTPWGDLKSAAAAKVGGDLGDGVDILWQGCSIEEEDDAPVGGFVKDGDSIVVTSRKNRNLQAATAQQPLAVPPPGQQQQQQQHAVAGTQRRTSTLSGSGFAALPPAGPRDSHEKGGGEKRLSSRQASRSNSLGGVAPPGDASATASEAAAPPREIPWHGQVRRGSADGGGRGWPTLGAEHKCSCKHSKCVKLYCVCWAAGLQCNNCLCKECFNTPENAEFLKMEQARTMARNPDAFSGKVEAGRDGDAAHKTGCRCRRSFCVKKYCECFNNSVKCSPQCRCTDCENKPLDGPEDETDGMAALASLADAAQLAFGMLSRGTAAAFAPYKSAAAAAAAAAAVQWLPLHAAGFLVDGSEGAPTALPAAAFLRGDDAAGGALPTEYSGGAGQRSSASGGEPHSEGVWAAGPPGGVLSKRRSSTNTLASSGTRALLGGGAWGDGSGGGGALDESHASSPRRQQHQQLVEYDGGAEAARPWGKGMPIPAGSSLLATLAARQQHGLPQTGEMQRRDGSSSGGCGGDAAAYEAALHGQQHQQQHVGGAGGGITIDHVYSGAYSGTYEAALQQQQQQQHAPGTGGGVTDDGAYSEAYAAALQMQQQQLVACAGGGINDADAYEAALLQQQHQMEQLAQLQHHLLMLQQVAAVQQQQQAQQQHPQLLRAVSMPVHGDSVGDKLGAYQQSIALMMMSVVQHGGGGGAAAAAASSGGGRDGGVSTSSHGHHQAFAYGEPCHPGGFEDGAGILGGGCDVPAFAPSSAAAAGDARPPRASFVSSHNSSGLIVQHDHRPPRSPRQQRRVSASSLNGAAAAGGGHPRGHQGGSDRDCAPVSAIDLLAYHAALEAAAMAAAAGGGGGAAGEMGQGLGLRTGRGVPARKGVAASVHA
ncbi:hypothetical protein FOA52_000186 [Chlamydomonas sp. UWO 241]|nr:hypothetical protein FOA52_000186 [Chlamydomonas sp. UWO 241]